MNISDVHRLGVFPIENVYLKFEHHVKEFFLGIIVMKYETFYQSVLWLYSQRPKVIPQKYFLIDFNAF